MVLARPTGPYSLLRLTSSTQGGKAAAAGCRSRGGHNCLNPDPERSQVGRLSVRCLIKFRPFWSLLLRLWAEVGTIWSVLRRREGEGVQSATLLGGKSAAQATGADSPPTWPWTGTRLSYHHYCKFNKGGPLLFTLLLQMQPFSELTMFRSDWSATLKITAVHRLLRTSARNLREL